MRKLIVTIVILILLIMIWLIAGHLKQRSDKISRLIPSEVVVYLELKGWEALKDELFGAHNRDKLKASLFQKNDSLSILIQTLKDRQGFDLDEEAIKTLLDGNIAFALHFPDGKESRTLLTVIGSRDKKTKSIIKKMMEIPPRYCDVEQYEGNDIFTVKESSPIFVAYTFIEDYLIFSFSEKQDPATLKEVIDIARGRDGLNSLAEDSTYNYSRKYADFSRSARAKLEFHILLDAWDDIVDAYPIFPIDSKWFLLAPGTFGRRIQDALTKRLRLHYILSGQLTLNQGITLKYFFESDNDSLERYYEEKFSPISGILPRICSSVNLTPSGSIFYLVFQTEIAFYWERRKIDWLNLDPSGCRKFFCALRDWEKESSLDLQEDCFSWMGREIAFAVEEVNGLDDPEFPGIILLCEVKDKIKSRQFLDKLKT